VNKRSNISSPSSRIEKAIDLVLLFFCCVVIAARGQISEDFPMGWRSSGPMEGPDIGQGEIPARLVFAGLIFLAWGIWLVPRLMRGWLTWRKSALMVPLVLLTAGSIVSTWAASNRSAALVESLTLLSQVLLAILLVQLLDAPWKQRLVLCVIMATGGTLAYRCWEQYRHEIPLTEQAFLANPDAVLQSQGIEPGSYAARQYAQRVASHDIGGFFPISNTAASYLLLTILVNAAVIRESWKMKKTDRIFPLLAIFVLLCQLAAFILLKSKGGMGGLAAAVALCLILWLGKDSLKKHWRSGLAVGAALMLLAILAVVLYGLHTGRLPGNSMWLRWQYWQASGAMIADHWLTGVGGHNFSQYYPRYMNGAAPEVVSDPHCILLSIWSQWGLLGIIAFLWAAAAVFISLARPAERNSDIVMLTVPLRPSGKRMWMWAISILSAVVMIRWAVSSLGMLTSEAEQVGVYIVSFAMPAAVWFLIFIIAWGALSENAKTFPANNTPLSMSVLFLGGGLLGYLAHNGIDMAFTQPGVGICFWAATAAAISIKRISGGRKDTVFSLKKASGISAACLVLAAAAGLWILVIFPFNRSYGKMKQAQSQALLAANLREAYKEGLVPDSSAERWKFTRQQALSLAQAAAQINRWDPEASDFAGELLGSQWRQSLQVEDLQAAVQKYQEAIRRDPAHFRYYRDLARLYQEAAILNSREKAEYQRQAAGYLEQALLRYPVKSELLIEYGRLLVEQQEKEKALDSFEQAIAIENAFLSQQRAMWGEAIETPWRLRPELRKYAETQIEILREEIR